jgi:hypothetical protein
MINFLTFSQCLLLHTFSSTSNTTLMMQDTVVWKTRLLLHTLVILHTSQQYIPTIPATTRMMVKCIPVFVTLNSQSSARHF